MPQVVGLVGCCKIHSSHSKTTDAMDVTSSKGSDLIDEASISVMQQVAEQEGATAEAEAKYKVRSAKQACTAVSAIVWQLLV